MSGKKGMSNNAPPVQRAADIVEMDLRQLAEDLHRWPVSKRISLNELVARAGVLVGRCKRLETRHDKTVLAITGQEVVV